MLVRTVGHGSLAAAQLLELLQAAGVGAVADVRRYPGSRRYPHVSRTPMEQWLGDGGVEYRWIEALGGRRKPVPGSRHVALRNDQFQAYADHMTSDEFRRGLAELTELAALASDERTVAVLCSEAVWWRCHRRLLADHLVLVEGARVEHLFHDGRLAPHAATPGVRLEVSALVYDAQTSSEA